ncbi:hypothetical protein [Azospirillum canadense]|uniref:hypothetical protein n=1 Tax=Azospirillum canadense TaxID=403962 RepID=UPI002226BA86|nr:hypothetical protein [Azospirillum canadense]MCW2235834.1 hypothetical protein [Azospirillum canadense]
MRLSQWPSFAQIAVSAFLLLTAVLELFDTMLEDLIGTEITTAHGLFVFAIGKILKEWLEVKEKFSATREKFSERHETTHSVRDGETMAKTRTA